MLDGNADHPVVPNSYSDDSSFELLIEEPEHSHSSFSPPPSARSTATAYPTESSTNHTRSRSLHLEDVDDHSDRLSPQHNHIEEMAIISPRSSNYERLEGGMGPSRMGNRRFAWKKFAIGAAVIIGLVWAFGPREPRKALSWVSDNMENTAKPQTTQKTAVEPVIPSKPDTKIPTTPQRPPLDADDPVNKLPSTSHPASFDEDPDPTKTTYCTSSYSKDRPLVQYALMIDAGSTGSRIHVYKFNNCGPSPSYEYEVFKMTQPGLSSFAGKPLDAAKSLDVLLNEAIRVVPESLRKCTPVAVKATAGLRLLPGSQSKDILSAVEARIKSEYPFQLHEPDGVVIMDGKDEGVYAWITANYLLNTIRADTPLDTPTYAVLDLGGASTQIVFEPAFTQPDSKIEEGEHKYDLDFGGRMHVLYQHSYLGYGLMRARRHVHQLVDFMSSLRNPASGAVDTIPPLIGNPCLARGTRKEVDIEDEKTKTTRSVTMDGEQIGSFEACNRVVELVMAKDAICELKPCSFNGVYQPSLLDSFPSGKVLLLSYFFDRLDPLLSSGNVPTSTASTSDKLTVSTIASLAKDVCLGRDTWLKRWGVDTELMKELEGRPEWCLDLTFMHALLRLGYEFGDDREVVIGKKIQETELGWCLGATIAMVGGGELKCRA